MNLVNLVNLVESRLISLNLTGSDKLVKYKVSRSEVFIKIIDIMIKIDLE